MSDETNVGVPPEGANATPPEGGDNNGAGGTPPAANPPEAGAGGNATPPEGTQPPEGGTPPEGGAPPADDTPPVRKTTADYIRERQERKANKDAANPNGGNDSGSEIHPDDLAIVDKVISEKYGDQFAQMADQALTGEINSFVQANPQFKGHEAKIKTYAKHEAYSRLPIAQVAYAAVGSDLMKAGADAARAADQEAAESATGGGSSRGMEAGKKDYSNMSFEEMEVEIMKAKGQI